jgi:hypothetical protein
MYYEGKNVHDKEKRFRNPQSWKSYRVDLRA